MFNNRITNMKLFLLLATLIATGLSVDTFAQARKPVLRRRTPVRKVAPAPKTYAVPAGTVLHVRINQSLNSKVSHIGDRFTATVVDPVYSSNGVLVIPQSSTL